MAIGRLKLRSCPIQVTLAMGALSPTGTGDYPYLGTVMSQVDKNGVARTDIDTTGAVFTAASTWVANCGARTPYTITTTTHVYTINASGNDANGFNIASMYSIGKQNDWYAGLSSGAGTLSGATLAGKVLSFRAGVTVNSGTLTNATGEPFRRQNYGTVGTAWAGVTITSDDPANPGGFANRVEINNGQYIKFKNVAFFVPTTSTVLAAVSIVSSSTTLPCTDIWFDGCSFIGPVVDPNSDLRGGAAAYLNGSGIIFNGTCISNIAVTGCTFLYTGARVISLLVGQIRNGGGAVAGNLVAENVKIVGNYIDVFWEIGIKLIYGGVANAPDPSLVNAIITDNVITRPASRSTDVGNPHADFILLTGAATATADCQVQVNRNFCIRGVTRSECECIAARDFSQQGSVFSAVADPVTTTINTGTASGGLAPHGLVTGDIVYFRTLAGTMGTDATRGLNTSRAGQSYSVTVTSTTQFTIAADTSGLSATQTDLCYIQWDGGSWTGEFVGNVVNDGSTEGIYIQNGKALKVANNTVSANPFYALLRIASITQASPGVITTNNFPAGGGAGVATNSGLANGDTIVLEGIVGMTELNGRTFTVANVDVGGTGRFTLKDGGVDVNTSTYTAFVSGTVEGRNTALSAHLVVGGSTGEKTTAGTHDISLNISDDLSYGGTPTLNQNLQMGIRGSGGASGVTGGYPGVFATLTQYNTPNTRAEALTMMATNAVVSGPGAPSGAYNYGAVGSGAINFPATNPSSTAGSDNV
jgi:hypothetical protein